MKCRISNRGSRGGSMGRQYSNVTATVACVLAVLASQRRKSPSLDPLWEANDSCGACLDSQSASALTFDPQNPGTLLIHSIPCKFIRWPPSLTMETSQLISLPKSSSHSYICLPFPMWWKSIFKYETWLRCFQKFNSIIRISWSWALCLFGNG